MREYKLSNCDITFNQDCDIDDLIERFKIEMDSLAEGSNIFKGSSGVKEFTLMVKPVPPIQDR